MLPCDNALRNGGLSIMDSINGFGTTGFGYGQYGYMSPAYQMERQHYLERMEAVQRQAARAHKGDHSVLMGEYHQEHHGAVKSAGYIVANLAAGAVKGAWGLVKGMFTDDQGNFSLAQTALTLVSFTAVGAAFRGLSLISKTAPALLKMGLGAAGLAYTVPTALQDAGRVASHYFHGNYEAAEEAANDLGQDIPGTLLAAGAFRSGAAGFKQVTNQPSLVEAFKSWATEKQGSGFTQAQVDWSKMTKPFRTQSAQTKSTKVGAQHIHKSQVDTPQVASKVEETVRTAADSTENETVKQVTETAINGVKGVFNYGSEQLNKASATLEGLKAYKPKWTDAKTVLTSSKDIGYTQIPLMMSKQERTIDEASHGGGAPGFYPGMGTPFMPGSPGIPMAGTNGTGFNIPTVIDLSTGGSFAGSESQGH